LAIKIEMLKCFAAVARHGSLSNAALELGRTPSAVSMMLKQFEDHVGAPLFETGRKSKLTSIGDLIYEQARHEVSHFETTVSVIEGLARSEVGYLRLAVTPSVATAILPPIISAFTKTHPKIQIELRDMDSASIARDLRRETADIGIGTLGDIEGMHRVALFSDAFGVICRADHALARQWDGLTWRDMHDHVFISNGLCHFITDPDFAPILANSRLMVHNTASLLGLVREGVGITVLPKLAATELHSDLAFLPLIDVTAKRTVHMVSKPAKLLLPAARAFVVQVSDAAHTGGLNDMYEFQNN